MDSEARKKLCTLRGVKGGSGNSVHRRPPRESLQNSSSSFDRGSSTHCHERDQGLWVPAPASHAAVEATAHPDINPIRKGRESMKFPIHRNETDSLCVFFQTMNHSSNDVKQLLARVCSFLARSVPFANMTPEFLKITIPMLVNGTKEKNTYVKANSELALVALLRLRAGDEGQQKCLALLDAGARESLSDVVSKVYTSSTVKICFN